MNRKLVVKSHCCITAGIAAAAGSDSLFVRVFSPCFFFFLLAASRIEED